MVVALTLIGASAAGLAATLWVPALAQYQLDASRRLGARIVSNERFRDWAGDYPEVSKPGHGIRGGSSATACGWSWTRSG